MIRLVPEYIMDRLCGAKRIVYLQRDPEGIEALAARYQNEDFWRRSMTEVEDEGPQ